MVSFAVGGVLDSPVLIGCVVVFISRNCNRRDCVVFVSLIIIGVHYELILNF